MEVLGKQLGGAVDSSVIDFRNEVVMELEKCIKEPFAMNPTSEARLFGQQEALNQIIEYLKYII
jgi:hypothetical protein